MTLAVAALVLFGVDVGTAAGIVAGSATESAVIGTASKAISHLDICIDQIAPVLLGVDLRREAQALATTLGAGSGDDGERSFPTFVERAFRAGSAAGMRISTFEQDMGWQVTIAGVRSGADMIEVTADQTLGPDDVAIVRGRRDGDIAASKRLGEEVPLRGEMGFRVVSRDVRLSRRDAPGMPVPARELGRIVQPELRRGIFITAIRCMG